VVLGVPSCTGKDKGHLSFKGREIVYVDFELVLQLELLIGKGKVSSICKQ
jgi:hypothetical protein